MMPAIFAHTRPSDFTKAHFNFVGDDSGENQILAAETLAFTQCQWRGDEIAGVTWICFPIDVVVIHGADHVPIEKGGIDRIGLKAGHQNSSAAIATAHRAVVFQQNPSVILLTAAKRAADGVEPK